MATDTFTLTIDYSQLLDEMVAAGRYDYARGEMATSDWDKGWPVHYRFLAVRK